MDRETNELEPGTAMATITVNLKEKEKEKQKEKKRKRKICKKNYSSLIKF